MKKFNIKNLKPWVTQLSEDFMGDYIENEDDREIFINQVVDYGENTCSTEQEVLCFVDGLLMKFPK